jgi:threonine dehydrogenase-like Zn-dependent dehydrogenase
METIQGRRVRAYQQTLEWMAEGKLDLGPLVTHRFRLDDHKRALAMTINRGRYGVIKSVFTFD